MKQKVTCYTYPKAYPYMKRFFLIVLTILAAALLVGLGYALLRNPSLERDWTLDERIMPTADIGTNLITVHNVRDFRYGSTTDDIRPHYYDATYDLRQLKGMYFIVEPFSSIKGLAHTMFSFEFAGGKRVMVSVEIRKQKGDSYNAILGIFNKYELMYVVGDEKDLLGLRATQPGVELYMYPVTASTEKISALFVQLMKEVNVHATKAEFYNSIFNNCTTKLVDAVNLIADPKIPWSWRYVLPGFSDEYAYSLGLIDNSVPFAELQKTHYITDLARKYQNDPNFSEKIRENMVKK